MYAKPEDIVLKRRQVDILLGQGMVNSVAVRQIGVTEAMCYRWRKQYRGMSRGAGMNRPTAQMRWVRGAKYE